MSEMLEQAVIDAISEWVGETTSDHLVAAARAAITTVRCSADSAIDTIVEAWSVLEGHGFPPEACEYLPAAIDNAITALVGAREDLLAEVIKLRDLNEPQTASVPALHALQRGNYEDRYPTDDILWSASDHKDFIEVVEVLGLQESHQTPADAVRELQAEIDRLRNEPQTAPSDIERAFRDACDEAGCAYDNEALLEAIQALKERCQAVSAPLASNASDPLETLEGNCWDLRCIDIPTGGGDADIGWNIVEHHMGPPKERIVGRGRSPREALQDATSTLSRPKCGDGQ